MAAFTGTLNANAIFAALYNMIISQQVFADNITGNFALVDKARVDGGLLGDTKLFYSTDVLKSAPWGNDAEAANLLALHRPDAPECQAITLDKFRQISLTVDNYLTKQAFADEGAFSSFNSVMLGWIRDTKKVYDTSLYNAYVGTAVGTSAKQSRTIPIAAVVDNATGTEAAQLEAMAIAQDIADLMIDLQDFSRSYNDYGNLRSYSNDSVKIVWNAKFVNKIKKVDLPTIFNKEGLMEKFEENVLPSRYFGTTIVAANIASYSASTPAAGKPIDSDDGVYVPGVANVNGLVRSLIETDVKVGDVTTHIFPGDEIPAACIIKVSGVSTGDFALGEVYIDQSASIIGKVLIKYPPYMSAFEVGTSFFNPKSLTENHYLTFGHNTLEYLKNYPMIKLIKG